MKQSDLKAPTRLVLLKLHKNDYFEMHKDLVLKVRDVDADTLIALVRDVYNEDMANDDITSAYWYSYSLYISERIRDDGGKVVELRKAKYPNIVTGDIVNADEWKSAEQNGIKIK